MLICPNVNVLQSLLAVEGIVEDFLEFKGEGRSDSAGHVSWPVKSGVRRTADELTWSDCSRVLAGSLAALVEADASLGESSSGNFQGRMYTPLGQKERTLTAEAASALTVILPEAWVPLGNTFVLKMVTSTSSSFALLVTKSPS